MTEEEQQAEATFLRRRTRFLQEGLNDQDAHDLAYQMLVRDRDFDDRRICFECKAYVNKHCTSIKDKYGRPTQQLRFILQRCDYFKLRGQS